MALRWTVVALTFAACTTNPPPSTSAPPALPSSPAASASASASAAPACAFWGSRGFKLEAYRVAGRGDFTRELSYEDASGTLKVHDSDPFAHGKEEKTPRVIDRTLTVPAAERDALANELMALCPSDTELKRRCAPGGCSRLEVTPKSGAPGKVEDAPLVGKVFTRLSAFFPELRN